MIFGTLALALVLLGGFCLGVERGKRVGILPVLADQTIGIASAQQGLPKVALPHAAARGARPDASRGKPVPVIRVSTPVVSGSAVSRSEALGQQAEGTYVIQLASYNGERSAREEASRLSKRGISAQVIPQGRYYELRAVGFRTRAQAQAALSGLSRTYRDAFIKRLGS